MSPTQAIRSIRTLIQEKLGVCPFCMRASALGSLITLAAWAAARALGPRWSLPGVVTAAIAVVAAGFTLLFLAHLVAYMSRTAGRIRRVESLRAASSPGTPNLTRRQFVSLVLQSGAYAATIAFLGHSPAFGQADACTGKKEPADPNLETSNANEATARALWDTFALFKCEQLCRNIACPGGKACVFSEVRPMIKDGPKCPQQPNGEFKCTGKVKQCGCQCDACPGGHRPSRGLGLDSVTGIDDNPAGALGKMNQQVRELCDKLCDQMKDCVNPPTCKRVADPQISEVKEWQPGPGIRFAETRVVKCHCNCAN